jgi:hypothetical protein
LPQPPPPPPHPPRLNQPRDFPSNYMYVPHTDIPQSYYRQDPRLARKLNCTCSLHPDLFVNNSLQPAATEPVNCKNGTSSPAQNIPASPPPPVTGAEPNSESSVATNSRQSVPKLTKGHTTTQKQDTIHPREEHSSNPSVQSLLQ